MAQLCEIVARRPQPLQLAHPAVWAHDLRGMIIYHELKERFLDDVLHDRVAERVHEAYQRQLGRRAAPSEFEAWRNSLRLMRMVLEDAAIPADCGVALEYQLPQSSKRIDVLISGLGPAGREALVIVELKQWSQVEATRKDAIVRTVLGGSLRETGHPSYQAWSYASLLANFNEYVDIAGVELSPCAYLHNLRDSGAVLDPHYREHFERAPVFLSHEAPRLREFLRERIVQGDVTSILRQVELSPVRPSKALADSVSAMLAGKPEFVLIDEQKLVYETALDLATVAAEGEKQVLVVHGGPGTGKSVVALNLLVELTKRRQKTHYVSKNAAPREVYLHKLAGSSRKTSASALFMGSGAFVDKKPDTFDTLIVDEAHRLNKFSGLYRNLGENQIAEIVRAARCSVFFLDESQQVTWHDIGSAAEIRRHARAAGASILELELPSQFRCSGSDGYIAWLDDVLGVRPTANAGGFERVFDFRVFDSACELRDAIFARNAASANRARVVAGYCWDWRSKKQRDAFDIELEDGRFRMRWNLADEGNLWLIGADSVNQAGCIHTCQGLELDYVGVLVGPDLVLRDGAVCTAPERRARMDKSIQGWKKLAKTDPEEARRRTDAIIRNTYRTLMTRGMKGCYVHCVDPALNAHFKARLSAMAG